MKIEVSDRVVLHRLTLDDAPEIFAAIDSQRDYLGRWLPFVADTLSVGDTIIFLDSVINSRKQEEVYAIRCEGEFAGLVGFKDTDAENCKTEIGYWLCQRFQGQGVMTASVRELCRRAFAELDINRIQIKCAVGNEPSRAIPLRLGFKFEGTERAGEMTFEGEFRDLDIFSMLRAEFI